MDLDRSSLRPPFCPWPGCPKHLARSSFTFRPFGHYRRRCEPRIITRFRCGHLWRTFSAPAFSTTYYLKHPELQLAIFRLGPGDSPR